MITRLNLGEGWLIQVDHTPLVSGVDESFQASRGASPPTVQVSELPLYGQVFPEGGGGEGNMEKVGVPSSIEWIRYGIP